MLVHYLRRLSRIVAASFMLTDHHQWTTKRLVHHVRRLSHIGTALFRLTVRQRDLISPEMEVSKLLTLIKAHCFVRCVTCVVHGL